MPKLSKPSHRRRVLTRRESTPFWELKLWTKVSLTRSNWDFSTDCTSSGSVLHGAVTFHIFRLHFFKSRPSLTLSLSPQYAHQVSQLCSCRWNLCGKQTLPEWPSLYGLKKQILECCYSHLHIVNWGTFALEKAAWHFIFRLVKAEHVAVLLKRRPVSVCIQVNVQVNRRTTATASVSS